MNKKKQDHHESFVSALEALAHEETKKAQIARAEQVQANLKSSISENKKGAL